MDEEIRLPPGLLPPERHYRPRRPSHLGTLFTGLAVAGLVYVVWWIGWRIFVPMSVWFAPENVGVVVAAIAVSQVIWRQRNVAAALTEYYEAVALLETGKVAEAGARLDAVCRCLSPHLPQHALCVVSRGSAYLRAGRPDRALSLFAAVLESGRLEKPGQPFNIYYPVLLSGIAAAYAMQGEIETAERWQGLAHDHVTPARSGLLLLMDVYLGARAGRGEVVVKDAEANWVNAAGVLLGAQMQAVRVLCAFALSVKNPNGVHDAKLRQFLAGARPCLPGQFDYLAVNWPELRAFLTENGLAGGAAGGKTEAAVAGKGPSRERPR